MNGARCFAGAIVLLLIAAAVLAPPHAVAGDAAPAVDAVARCEDALRTRRRITHALTVAAGGRLARFHEYGRVAFGNAEAAWELRTGGGFDLLVGGGLG